MRKKIDTDQLFVPVNAFNDESAYIPYVYTSEKVAQDYCDEMNKTDSNKWKVITLSEHMQAIYNRSIYLD